MNHSSRSCRPASLLHRIADKAAWLTGLFVILALCGPVSAQGTSGTLPDPISSRELDRYIKRLELSPQQAQAAVSFHDFYREEFRTLREGDIEKYLQSAGPNTRGPMGGMNLDRKQIEQNIRELDSMMDKIKAVDSRFFDQIQTVLTEGQLPTMQQVRQARDRARYRTGLGRMAGMFNPSIQMDVSDLVSEVDLSPQERETVVPMIAQYESNLTRESENLYKSANNVPLVMLDKFAAAGFTEDSFNDPEQRGRMFQEFRTIWREANQKVQETGAEITQLNRRTVKSVSAVIEEQKGAELRTRFYEQSYPQLRSGSNLLRAFKIALGYDTLSQEQKDGITGLRTQYISDSDRVTEQMADLTDDSRRTTTMFDFDSDQRRQLEQQQGELRERRTSIEKTTMDNLNAILGEDLAGKLAQRVAEVEDDEPAAGQFTITLSAPGGGAAAGGVMRLEAAIQLEPDESASLDPYLPGPISSRDIHTYGNRLGVTDEQRIIVESLHEDYMERFDQVKDTQVKAVQQAQQELWSFDAQTNQMKSPVSEDIDRVYDLRKQALAAIQTVDGTFFDDLQTTIVSDDQLPLMQRIRLSRERDIYRLAASGDMGLGGAMFGRGMERAFRGAGQNRRNEGGGGGAGAGAGGGNERRGDGERRGGRGQGGPGGGAGGMFRAMGMSQSDEPRVDVTSVVESLSLDQPTMTKVDPVLAEYEQTVTGVLKTAYESAMRVQMSMEKMMADGARGGGDAGPGQRRMEMVTGGMRDLMEGDGKVARENRQAVVTLNRETLTKLADTVDGDTSSAIRSAYNRKAYPGVYRDERSADDQLSAALALPDLSSEQRGQIDGIAMEYRGGYQQLCEKMIDLSAQSAAEEGQGFNRDWTAMQERQRSMETLSFDRDDLSDKTRSRLRAVLSEDQAKAAGLTRQDMASSE